MQIIRSPSQCSQLAIIRNCFRFTNNNNIERVCLSQSRLNIISLQLALNCQFALELKYLLFHWLTEFAFHFILNHIFHGVCTLWATNKARKLIREKGQNDHLIYENQNWLKWLPFCPSLFINHHFKSIDCIKFIPLKCSANKTAVGFDW